MTHMCDNDFRIYEKKITKLINKKLTNKKSEKILDDILLDDYIIEHSNEMKISLALKQLQMKIGFIWQIVIGNYIDFEDLAVGHSSGLDVRNKKRKIIIELKNRYNTDNYASKKTNLKKLAKYKKTHPSYECIYGIINEKNTKPNGYTKIIEYNGE